MKNTAIKKTSIVLFNIVLLANYHGMMANGTGTQQIISPVQACGNGAISGGSTIICVQTTTVSTGGGGVVEPGKKPTAMVSPSHKKAAMINEALTPTVSLGKIATEKKFPLNLPAFGSSVLYKFTPTTGVSANNQITVMMTIQRPDQTLYQQGGQSGAYSSTEQDLYIYKKVTQGWMSIGLITNVDQYINIPDSTGPAPVTLASDGVLTIPQESGPVAYNIAAVGTTTTTGTQPTTTQVRPR